MADGRTYREDEVREIFALATTEPGTSLPTPTHEGEHTLEELQDVGREIGLRPERVAEAAAVLDSRPEIVPPKKWLGAPVSVGRIIGLPRAATDREWRFLVAELRETFESKGEVTSGGGVREWTDDNLHAVLEETEAGHRLRLGTGISSAAGGVAGGILGIGMALFFTVVMFAAGKTGAELLIPAFFALVGGVSIGATAIHLPRWAAERERQMEHIARRASALLQAPPREDEITQVEKPGSKGG